MRWLSKESKTDAYDMWTSTSCTTKKRLSPRERVRFYLVSTHISRTVEVYISNRFLWWLTKFMKLIHWTKRQMNHEAFFFAVGPATTWSIHLVWWLFCEGLFAVWYYTRDVGCVSIWMLLSEILQHAEWYMSKGSVNEKC